MSQITDGFGKPIKQAKSILVPEHEYEQLKNDLASNQAKIDELMLEFCPERMTEAQKENWVKHQVPADPQPSIKDLSGYERITSNDQLLHFRHYWVCYKTDKTAFFIGRVKNIDGQRKAVVLNGMNYWAYENNDQALKLFDIYGPINPPYHIEVVG